MPQSMLFTSGSCMSVDRERRDPIYPCYEHVESPLKSVARFFALSLHQLHSRVTPAAEIRANRWYNCRFPEDPPGGVRKMDCFSSQLRVGAKSFWAETRSRQ